MSQSFASSSNVQWSPDPHVNSPTPSSPLRFGPQFIPDSVPTTTDVPQETDSSGKNLSGCASCRIRKKKCPGPSGETQDCFECVRLGIECLHLYGKKIPKTLRNLRLQEHITKHTLGRGRGRASRIPPKLLLRRFIPPTLLQSIALPPPGENHTSDPSPIGGIMTHALPLPLSPSFVSPPTGSQSPIPENHGSVSTPEIRFPSVLHPPPVDNHEYPPIPALNLDGTPVEQNMGAANPVASLSFGVTGQWHHEAGPHHLDSGLGFTGAPLQHYSPAPNGYLGGDVLRYPQFMGPGIAASSGPQNMGVASGERMRSIPDNNFVGHWEEPEATQEDPTAILGYDAGLQQNESSPVASRRSRVDAAGPSNTVPCDPLFTQGHQASSNRRVHTHDATSSPLPTQVGGGWYSVPYAGGYSTIPSLTVATSLGSQYLQPPVPRHGYEASPRGYGSLDAPQPLEAPEPYAQSVFGSIMNTPEQLQTPLSGPGAPEFYPNWDEL